MTSRSCLCLAGSLGPRRAWQVHPAGQACPPGDPELGLVFESLATPYSLPECGGILRVMGKRMQGKEQCLGQDLLLCTLCTLLDY